MSSPLATTGLGGSEAMADGGGSEPSEGGGGNGWTASPVCPSLVNPPPHRRVAPSKNVLHMILHGNHV